MLSAETGLCKKYARQTDGWTVNCYREMIPTCRSDYTADAKCYNSKQSGSLLKSNYSLPAVIRLTFDKLLKTKQKTDPQHSA